MNKLPDDILKYILLFSDTRIRNVNEERYIREGSRSALLRTCKKWLAIGREIFDPFTYEGQEYALQWACQQGKIEDVKILLRDKKVDPSDNNNEPIVLASYYGHTQIVKLLLRDPRVDPSVLFNAAVRFAYQENHWDTLDELLKSSKISEYTRMDYGKRKRVENITTPQTMLIEYNILE